MLITCLFSISFAFCRLGHSIKLLYIAIYITCNFLIYGLSINNLLIFAYAFSILFKNTYILYNSSSPTGRMRVLSFVVAFVFATVVAAGPIHTSMVTRDGGCPNNWCLTTTCYSCGPGSAGQCCTVCAPCVSGDFAEWLYDIIARIKLTRVEYLVRDLLNTYPEHLHVETLNGGNY